MWLRTQRRRGEVGIVARSLGVSERTVRNWIAREGGPCGRRPRSGAERRRAFVLVVRAWRWLGRGAGWRRVRTSLAGALPVRLVQECLSRAKRLARAHAARRRVHVEVRARDVMWHLDATHLGRTGAGEVQAQVLRDAAEPCVLAASAGGPVTSADAVALVGAAIEAAGTSPLVLATDNGPPYVAADFERLLVAHRIVHLKNLPHTPQHNARAERTIRDVKADCLLGKGVRLSSLAAAAAPLAAACRRLDLRAGAGSAASCSYTSQQRADFYEDVCRSIEIAVRGTRGARARRMAEREAIHVELEDRGLIERTRGGRRSAGSKAEINS